MVLRLLNHWPLLWSTEFVTRSQQVALLLGSALGCNLHRSGGHPVEPPWRASYQYLILWCSASTSRVLIFKPGSDYELSSPSFWTSWIKWCCPVQPHLRNTSQPNTSRYGSKKAKTIGLSIYCCCDHHSRWNWNMTLFSKSSFFNMWPSKSGYVCGSVIMKSWLWDWPSCSVLPVIKTCSLSGWYLQSFINIFI